MNSESEKLSKVTKDNDRLRDLLIKMKKTFLEKLELEKKLKMEIDATKKKYPTIMPLKRTRNEDDHSTSKRPKMTEDDKDFTKFEKSIDNSISQRNYHSKYIV